MNVKFKGVKSALILTLFGPFRYFLFGAGNLMVHQVASLDAAVYVVLHTRCYFVCFSTPYILGQGILFVSRDFKADSCLVPVHLTLFSLFSCLCGL